MPETVSERSVNIHPDQRATPYGWGMALSELAGRSVLVVDDESMVREVVASYLAMDGLTVEVAADGVTALDLLKRSTPDLVVLDVMLPGVDGFSLLRRLRNQGDIPVIMLTARSDEADRVLGLELGADDYVVKPFSPRELAARVRAVLKRSNQSSRPDRGLLEVGELTMDFLSRETRIGERSVDLKPKEFDLLHFLASHPRQVFSRGQLLKQVWDSDTAWQDPSTVTVHVRRVRQAIEPEPNTPRYVTTVWGVGYRFEP